MALPSPPIDAGGQELAYDLCIPATNGWSRPSEQRIRLAPDRIGWTLDGRDCEALIGDIVEIHLSAPIMTAPAAAIPVSIGSATVPLITGGLIITPGVCRIRFRDGGRLTVLNCDSWSRYDSERATQYQDFVLQLHRRLSPAQRSSIPFGSGASAARYAVNKTVFLVACVVIAWILGLALLLADWAWPALILPAFCVPALWFVHRVVRATAPRRYDPEHVPEGLLTVHALPYAAPDDEPGALADLAQRALATPKRRKALIAALSATGFLAVAGTLIWVTGVRETERMFEPGEVHRGLELISRSTVKTVHVREVEITPRAVTVKAMDPKGPPRVDASGHFSQEQNWRVSHMTLWGWHEWDRVAGPKPASSDQAWGAPYAWDLSPPRIAIAAELAKTMLARTALSGDLVVNVRFFEVGPAGKPQWQAQVEDAHGASERSAFDGDGAPIEDNPRPPSPAPQISADEAFAKATEAYQRREYSAALWGFREAADRGDAVAQVNLGTLYAFGQGVPQDYAQAVGWFRKAAIQGLREAQYDVAIAYQEGQGAPQDYAEALRWYRKAAEQGLDRAQNNLARLYHDGQGVAQDYAEALRWYQKAADQGYSAAQLHLGTMYVMGHGVAQDYAEASRWYRKAADQGVEAAQYDVGLIYANGLGVPRNQELARPWMEKAASQGNDQAKRWLEANQPR